MTADPASGVGLGAALAAGTVSFLSPCVLPLVPGYLSAVTGVSVSDLGDAGVRRVLVPSLLFIASFSAIFIALGLASTGVGQALRDHRETLNKVAAAVIMLMGAIFVLSLIVARLNREWHVEALLAKAGSGGPVVAGAAFAIAWTPCVGPTLGAINALAAVNGNVLQGMGLLAVYSAGLAIPFLITALAFSRMTTAFGAIKRHYWVITTAGGVILIAMGILILTGEFFQLNIEAQKLTNDLGLNL